MLEEEFRSVLSASVTDNGVVPAEVPVGLSAGEAVPFPGLTGLADIRTTVLPIHPIHYLQRTVSTAACTLLCFISWSLLVSSSPLSCLSVRLMCVPVQRMTVVLLVAKQCMVNN